MSATIKQQEHTALLKELVALGNQQLAELRAIRRALSDEEDGPTCPHCNETDPEKIQATPTMDSITKGRLTCSSCGKSWKEEQHA